MWKYTVGTFIPSEILTASLLSKLIIAVAFKSLPPSTKPLPKYDEVSSTKSYTKSNSVTLSIQKIDKETSKPLSNVSFDLYKDNIKVTTVTTDNSNTNTNSNDLDIPTFLRKNKGLGGK